MARWPLLASLLLTATLLGGCAGVGGNGGHLEIRSIDVSAPVVGAGHVTLAVNVTFEDARKAGDDDVVRVKTYDESTGFLAHTDERRLSTALPAGRPVEVDVDLPRSGAYRLDVLVLHGDKVEATGSVPLRDLSRLLPTINDSGLRIDLDFQLLRVAGNRTDLQTTAYLTNEARAASRPLTLQLKARESRTGLVAGQTWSPVGSVAPDATRAANATMDLALGRDYDVEAILWDGDAIVERGTGRVALATLGPAPAVGGAGSAYDRDADNLVLGAPSYSRSAGEGKNSSPGLGLVAVVGAVVVVGVLMRKRAA
jgi:hypothetical protein